jgi:hypothetical protein
MIDDARFPDSQRVSSAPENALQLPRQNAPLAGLNFVTTSSTMIDAGVSSSMR